MPTRSARSPIPRLLTAAILALALLTPAAARAQTEVALSLPEARDLAVYALKAGKPDLAIQVAEGLLQADGGDAVAWFVIASAQAQANRPRDGRRAAAQAYRFSPPGPDRLQAAQMAARMAYAENRHSLAQLWLRRTALHVASEEERAQLAEDYRLLRRINPWAFRLQVDLSPSNNVNNGADTALQIIDGVPVIGTLSGEAQALSGLIGTADLDLSYRLRANATSATTLAGRLYLQRVALSDSAQEKAPRASGSDFASTYAEAALSHGFAVGAQGGSALIEAAGGESWWAGARSYRFGRLRLERAWLIGADAWLRLSGSAERRFMALYAVNDARILGFGGQFSRVLGNGDRLTLSMALRDSQAESINGTFRSASLRAAYAFDQRFGPLRLSAGLTLGYSDYPEYRSGYFMVPGGRQDQSIYGDLSLFFDRLDYAGFAPMLRLRSGRKSSNDSRFDTREITVSLGIESKF